METAPELIIYAPDQERAQRVANLIGSALIAWYGEMFSIDYIIVVSDQPLGRDKPSPLMLQQQKWITPEMHLAVELAAKFSRRHQGRGATAVRHRATEDSADGATVMVTEGRRSPPHCGKSASLQSAR